MKTLPSFITQLTAAVLVTIGADAAEPRILSAKELAANLNALQQDGSSYVRLKLDVKQPSGNTKLALQLQIKQRRSKTSTELVYQVLWPKNRAGEAVLLKKSGNQAATGVVFTPPNTFRPIDASQMKDPLFGSDLSYSDVIESFFAWDQQTLVGTETVNRANCQIIESKPGKGQHSTAAVVRTWVDSRRLVPIRVEKYQASGALLRRIETIKVVTDDQHRSVPGNLSVHSSQSDTTTDLDGTRLNHGVVYADREFTAEGLKEVTTPRSGAE